MRNLPVVDDEEVKAVITMVDISAQIFESLKRPLPGLTMLKKADMTVGDVLNSPDACTPGLSVALPLGASVAQAVQRMRDAQSGSLLVLGDGKAREPLRANAPALA